MKNQIGKGVKVNIFGFCFIEIWIKDGKYTMDVYSGLLIRKIV